MRKNDKGKYDVSADRATAASVGLNVPPEPPAPGAHATTAPQAEPGRTDQPRGPIIDTAPKPEQGPGQSTSPRPGGVVSIPGGPSILTPPGIGIATKPETKPAPSGGLGLDGPLLDRPPAQNGQSGTPAAEDKGPDVEIGARTGSTVIYTVDTPEKAARAAEILMSGKVASPNEAAALNSALSAQEVRYSSTAKAAGNGVTADEAGTTALKVKYQNGRVSGTELKSEFEVNGAEDFHGVGLKAGDKLSFTTIDDGGAISHRSIAEVSGSAAAPGAGILNNVGGDRTEYKFTSQGMEVNSFLTSQQGVNIPFGPGSVAASVELEDRIYHSAPA
ncbi:MAG TPA: hypothetical protein VFA20_14420 [Myxococcaceae bacterium]|nr:hypothetical protein [Myxococcaceae bacterium]